MREIIVDPLDSGRRLDKYLIKYLDKASPGVIYKGLRKKNIKLNDNKAEGNELLKEGDSIKIFFSEETFSLLKSENGHDTDGDNRIQYDARKLIIYEDDNLIIADKPAGMLSQRSGPLDLSINEILLQYVKKDGLLTDTFSPSVCNRLDRNTSGLITFAKNYQSARILSSMFKDRSIKKYYLAVVAGEMTDGGHMTAWIKKNEKTNRVIVYDTETEGADRIETEFEVINPVVLPNAGREKIILQNGILTDKNIQTALVKVELITGKTHQIRAHFASIGHPVAGDPKYGDPALNRYIKGEYGINRQLLHSLELRMPEKVEKPLEYLSGKVFRSPVPGAFVSIIFNAC